MDDETQLVEDSFEEPTDFVLSVTDSDEIESEDESLVSNSDSSVDNHDDSSEFDYEFDVTTSSMGIPEEDDGSRSPMMSLLNNINLSWVSRASPRWRR